MPQIFGAPKRTSDDPRNIELTPATPADDAILLVGLAAPLAIAFVVPIIVNRVLELIAG